VSVIHLLRLEFSCLSKLKKMADLNQAVRSGDARSVIAICENLELEVLDPNANDSKAKRMPTFTAHL
jgi:hypothetical protein